MNIYIQSIVLFQCRGSQYPTEEWNKLVYDNPGVNPRKDFVKIEKGGIPKVAPSGEFTHENFTIPIIAPEEKMPENTSVVFCLH